MMYSTMTELLVKHLVDEAVFERFFGRHEVIAVGVSLDPFERLSGALRQNMIQACRAS